MSSIPPGFGTSSCRWSQEPRGGVGEVAALYMQHRLVFALRASGIGEVTAASVARATGIAPKTCQRHLSGAQPLSLEHLLLWRVAFGLDVASLVPQRPAVLVPAPYVSRLRHAVFGGLRPPGFAPRTIEPDWQDICAGLLSRARVAMEAGAPHLLTPAAVASAAALDLVAQGVPAALVKVEADGVRLDVHDRLDVRVVVSLERADAAAVVASLLAGLVNAPLALMCLLGSEAVAVLRARAPLLADVADGGSGTLRLQDARSDGVDAGTLETDLEVLVGARTDSGLLRCIFLQPKQ